MKASVVDSRISGLSTVEISQGGQFFLLNYTGTKTECEWYAKMFRIALRRHNVAMLAAARARTSEQEHKK